MAFVGRITRQKGVGHLIAAAATFDPDIQFVLCAGAPDTPEIEAETERPRSTDLQRRRGNVFWVREMLPTEQVRQILSAATVFVCPSVYEPLGIVNLEAMACETAVVASDVGGIPEVVVDGVTGRSGALQLLRAGGSSSKHSLPPSTTSPATGRSPRDAARPGGRGRSRSSPGHGSPSDARGLPECVALGPG